MKLKSMSDSSRIMKNTIFLTFRMLVILVIGLYSSRIILAQLGVSDFGLYNIVGGVVVLFSFFNNSLAASMQRFICCAIGNDEKNDIQKVFSSCCLISLTIMLIIILLVETGGLWFVKYKLTIPSGQHDMAVNLLHLSLMAIIFDVMRQPYYALIISYERMSFFAYVSLFEAVIKLALILLLCVLPYNKLLTYAILQVMASILTTLIYYSYSKRNFKNVRYSLSSNMSDIKDIANFTFWNTISSVADVGYMQGSNIVLNIFYGVTMNATMGITNQVKNAVYTFTRNIQIAASPQIIKNFSARLFDDYKILIIRVSKISCYIMIAIGLPIYFNIDYILDLWLTVIPQNCSVFIKLMLIFSLIDTLTGPLWVSMQATGKIRLYQVVISIGLLLNLPVLYIVYYMGAPAQAIILVQIAIVVLLLIVRIGFLIKYCGITLKEYVVSVILPVISVTFISTIFPLLFRYYYYDCDDTVYFILSVTICFVSAVLTSFYVGLTKIERLNSIALVKKKFNLS